MTEGVGAPALTREGLQPPHKPGSHETSTLARGTGAHRVPALESRPPTVEPPGEEDH